MKENSVVFTTKGNKGAPRARARFLRQAIQLEEQHPSTLIQSAIYFTILTLFATIVWAWLTNFNEVAIAPGEVVPAGLIHDIQHLEGGIVSEIHVRNGDRVQRGDLLLMFSPSSTQSEFDQTRVRKASLEMEQERLQAISEERAPDFGSIGEQFPALALKQLTIHQAQLASLEGELNVLDAQIRQRNTELMRQENQAESIKKEIWLLREQVTIRTQLAAKNVVAKTELLSTQTRLAEVESERRTIEDSVIVAQSALQEAKQRRSEFLARFAKDIQLEAGEVSAELADFEQTLIRLEDRVDRLIVKAPVSGIVQGLSITRINAVVNPGQVIMQIVPMDDDMIVEARVSPKDIGHIRAGQPVDVKIDSYDSARFGSVDGTIKRISPSTYLDEQRNPYYLAEIDLAQSWVGQPSQRMHVIPGMTVKTDIKTGTKTLLDYMLKPITRGFSSAFRER